MLTRFDSSLVAVDLDLDNQCYCQDDCQCLDLGHGMGYYVATRDNVIAELPGMCGGCSDVCTEKMYKGSCAGFKREAKGKWGDWTLPEYEGIACSKDQCCAANEDECCELNVGMIAGVAVAIFVVVAGCMCAAFWDARSGSRRPVSRPRCPWSATLGSLRRRRWRRCPRRRRRRRWSPIPEHKKQRRFPEPSAPLPPSLAPIKAQAAGMMHRGDAAATIGPGRGAGSVDVVGGMGRALPTAPRVLARAGTGDQRNGTGTGGPCRGAGSVSSEGWGARGLQRLASWRAPAAAPPPITLGGKKVDVAQEELCSPRRVDMVHASVAKWYNSTGKGAALRTRFGPFPATPGPPSAAAPTHATRS